MNSAFFVFHLVARNAGSKVERNAGGVIHPKLDDDKERSGLSFEKRVSRSGRECFAKRDGSHQKDFGTECSLV